MKQIRHGVFETNSSSTHSITICPKKDFDKWQSNDSDLYLNQSWSKSWSNSSSKFKDKDFVTKEEALDIITKDKYHTSEEVAEMDEDDINELLVEEGFENYEKFSDRDMEYYEKYYKTEGGDEIVAFGYYGYDG